MIFDATGIEETIGYVFNDKMLLRKCFTHSSYGNEHGEDNNELLEFFGDAVIEYIVTEYLFKNAFGDEGKLTAKRAEIVSKSPLLNVVKRLGLDKYVLLGKGQEKTKTQDEKLFSSVYEALVAGIYLDGGIVKAKRFVKNTLIKDYERGEQRKLKIKTDAKAKSEFQEYVQKRHIGSVGYEVLNRTGPDHLPEFRVAALLNGGRIAEAKGASIQAAEAAAAAEALAKLKKQDGKKN